MKVTDLDVQLEFSPVHYSAIPDVGRESFP
jgi:hypothetical protein